MFLIQLLLPIKNEKYVVAWAFPLYAEKVKMVEKREKQKARGEFGEPPFICLWENQNPFLLRIRIFMDKNTWMRLPVG